MGGIPHASQAPDLLVARPPARGNGPEAAPVPCGRRRHPRHHRRQPGAARRVPRRHRHGAMRIGWSLRNSGAPGRVQVRPTHEGRRTHELGVAFPHARSVHRTRVASGRKCSPERRGRRTAQPFAQGCTLGSLSMRATCPECGLDRRGPPAGVTRTPCLRAPHPSRPTLSLGWTQAAPAEWTDVADEGRRTT